MIEKLPFELLEVLISAAESKNLYEAAHRLGLSQAAVSVKLKQLESLLPLPAFGVEGKKKVLSHYGRALYEVAKTQRASLGTALEKLNRTYASAETLNLKVGSRPEMFEAFTREFDFGGRIDFVLSSGHEAVDRLLSHEIDIAITYEQPNSAEILSKKLITSGCSFIVHSDWLKGESLTLKKASDPTFLKQTPCIIYHLERDPSRTWIHQHGLNQSELKIKYLVEDWRSIRSLVTQKAGWAIVPDYLLTDSAGTEKITLPEKIIPKLTFYLLYHPELKQLKVFSGIHSRL